MLKYFFILTLFCQFSYGNTKSDGIKLFEKRDVLASLQESLTNFEKAHTEVPTDLETLTYLARGYFLLSEYHLLKEEEKMIAYDKAKRYGEKALELNLEYKTEAANNIEKAIDKLTIKEVEPLFWSAVALGKWAKLNGVMSSLRYKGQILSMIKKVEKLRPDLLYGAVPRFWGGFYAVAPAIAGGDMRKSKKNFQKAMEMAPEFLATKRVYAELYLVEKEEEKEFKKVLEEVLKAPEGPAEIAPDNRMEKKQAEKLLSEMDDLF